MENRDLLQAWALTDPEYTAKLIESWVDASKGNDLWTDSLSTTLNALTSPRAERLRILFRYSGGHWFPGTDL
jgi:hypothetical protein